MTATTATDHKAKATTTREKLRDPGWLAFTLLRIVLGIAPLVTGIDKFFDLITYWPKYLAPIATDIAPLGGEPFMYVVGVLEIALGLLVLFVPRYGAPMLAAWLLFIVINLLLVGGYLDIALRDTGLASAAFVLFVLTFYRPGSVSKAPIAATTADSASAPNTTVDEQEYRNARHAAWND